jgi:hypothetical protein
MELLKYTSGLTALAKCCPCALLLEVEEDDDWFMHVEELPD